MSGSGNEFDPLGLAINKNPVDKPAPSLFGGANKVKSPVSAAIPIAEPEPKKDNVLGGGLSNLANLPPPIISKPKVT